MGDLNAGVRGSLATPGFHIQTEEADGVLQLFGLGTEFFAGGSHFFTSRSVLLNNLIQLLDGFVDLLGASVLFLAGGGDFLHQFGGALDVGEHLGEHDAGFLGDFDAAA